MRPCRYSTKKFQPKGCPEKSWDRVTGEGCPYWKEYNIPTENGKPVIVRDCIDCLSELWAFKALGLLEGNQVATESFRNGMCETGPDNKVYPKASLGFAAMVNTVQRAVEDVQLLAAHSPKQINHE